MSDARVEQYQSQSCCTCIFFFHCNFNSSKGNLASDADATVLLGANESITQPTLAFTANNTALKDVCCKG